MGVIVVTGATGFIGRALCREFAAHGRAYRAVVRRPPEREFKGGEHVVVAALETAGPAELAAAMAGASAVVHLAGRAHVLRETIEDPLAAYRAANVEATRRVVEAAVTAQVPRFVFASTVKVHGEVTPPGRPFTPDAPIAPRDHYGTTKAEAERIVRAACEGTRSAALVLRLPLVYGAGVRGNFLSLLDAVAAQKRLPVGAIENRRSLLYAGNLVDAIVAALDAAEPISGAHFVADAKSVSTPDLVRAIAAALHEPVRLLRVPVPLLRIIGAATGRSAQIARLTGSLEVDASSFRRATGWAPRHALEAGLAATAAWWRTRHSI